MFYDPVYYKMIPRVFILLNNKTMYGYIEVLNFLKHHILQTISNNINKIKWKTVTTDFEVGLYTAFNKVFNFIKNIKYVGCFFHFLKNIRKYLFSQGFNKKDKKENLNYVFFTF